MDTASHRSGSPQAPTVELKTLRPNPNPTKAATSTELRTIWTTRTACRLPSPATDRIASDEGWIERRTERRRLAQVPDKPIAAQDVTCQARIVPLVLNGHSERLCLPRITPRSIKPRTSAAGKSQPFPVATLVIGE